MSSSVSWAAPIYSSVFPPSKFWRQENKRYYSATGGLAQHPPPPPPLAPTTISDLQTILKLYSNKYYLINPPQHTNSLISPLTHPSLTSHRTCRGTIMKYFGGWLDSFTMDHGHPFKLHLTAICRKQVDFTMLSSQQSVRRNDKIKVGLFSLFRVKKQGVTMYTYWCASKYFRISFVFFVTILCTELSLKTEVNANNL